MKIRPGARNDAIEMMRVRRDAILAKAGTHYDPAALAARVFEAVDRLVCDASLNAERFHAANGYGAEGRKDHVSIPEGVVSAMIRMSKRRPPAAASG